MRPVDIPVTWKEFGKTFTSLGFAFFFLNGWGVQYKLITVYLSTTVFGFLENARFVYSEDLWFHGFDQLLISSGPSFMASCLVIVS